MTKCVSQPFGFKSFGFALSSPYPKSIPNSPNAGIKILKPRPSDLLELNGLNSLKSLYP